MELAKAYAESPRGVEILQAVRSDSVIGRGSCSSVDEAMSDAEVMLAIAFDHKTKTWKPLTTPKQAVRLLRRHERLVRGL